MNEIIRRRSFLRRLGATGALLAPGLLGTRCGPGGPSAVLGAKTYSEQIILGELLSRFLRAAGLAVTERFQMQTFVLHTAIANGDLDCYIEYTGTSYSAIMHETFVAGQTAEEIYQRVKELYRERFDLRLGPPIGFFERLRPCRSPGLCEGAGPADDFRPGPYFGVSVRRRLPVLREGRWPPRDDGPLRIRRDAGVHPGRGGHGLPGDGGGSGRRGGG